jgi:hypothetical protein
MCGLGGIHARTAEPLSQQAPSGGAAYPERGDRQQARAVPDRLAVPSFLNAQASLIRFPDSNSSRKSALESSETACLARLRSLIHDRHIASAGFKAGDQQSWM